jgi:hypothetical protein
MRVLAKAAAGIERVAGGAPAPPKPPATPAGVLRETDLVTPAGAINRAVLMRIAAARARREFLAYAATGAPRPWRALFAEQLMRTWSIARVLAECRAGRRAVAALPAAERKIRQLELRLEILRRGLATPSCAKTQDDLAQIEALLERARAQAQP